MQGVKTDLKLDSKTNRFSVITKLSGDLRKEKENIEGNYFLHGDTIIFNFKYSQIIINPMFNCKDPEDKPCFCNDTLLYKKDFVITKDKAIILKRNNELANKLQLYFEGIPVLQSADSILNFVLKNTKKYETTFLRNSLDKNLESFDVTVSYFKNDTIVIRETDIYYRTHTSPVIGLEMDFNSVFGAKRQYRKVKRELSKYFSKTSSRLNRNSLSGGKWKLTKFYLNKNDPTPFMEINWSRRTDGFNNNCRIQIYKNVDS